jgi:membrane-associated phospholipid phosphatase
MMRQTTSSPAPDLQRRPRPARRAVNRLVRLGVALAALALLAYGIVWSYRFAQAQFGAFTPLVAVLGGALLVALVGPPLLVYYRHQIRAELVRALHWLGAVMAATGLPQRFARRYPRLAHFLAARFTPGNPTGLALTVWLVVAAALLEQVVELTIEVASGSPVAALDHRIINLVATMRAPELDVFMYAVTWLGDPWVVVPLAIAAVLIALVLGRPRPAGLLILVTGASWLSDQALRFLVARPRPPLVDARIVESGFSFPSSHAVLSSAVYGAVAYLLMRGLRRDWLRVVVGTLAALIVILVGVSRGYLGVHYPSDVLAGWALGGLWVALLAIAEHLWRAEPRSRAVRPFLPRALAIPSAAAFTLAAVAYVGATVGGAAQSVPPPAAAQPVPPVVVAPGAAPTAVEQQLPHYTEGLTGDRQEPVSLVFVGDQAQLEAAFRNAGWTEAQRFSFRAVEGGLRAALTQRGDPAGPVTPSFLAEQPNALGFSLPVGATFAQRHHLRIWSTDVQTSDGKPVWLATASYDRGFELAPSTFLPTHQIAPDIDTERAFVVAGLQNAGAVVQQQTIQLVPAESGHNFDGDPFFTDGRSVILYLG